MIYLVSIAKGIQGKVSRFACGESLGTQLEGWIFMILK